MASQLVTPWKTKKRCSPSCIIRMFQRSTSLLANKTPFSPVIMDGNCPCLLSLVKQITKSGLVTNSQKD